MALDTRCVAQRPPPPPSSLCSVQRTPHPPGAGGGVHLSKKGALGGSVVSRVAISAPKQSLCLAQWVCCGPFDPRFECSGALSVMIQQRNMLAMPPRQRTVRCAKSRLFLTHFPRCQGDRSNYCVPRHATTQSKNLDNELKQMYFPLKMPEYCLNLQFLPCGPVKLPR